MKRSIKPSVAEMVIALKEGGYEETKPDKNALTLVHVTPKGKNTVTFYP